MPRFRLKVDVYKVVSDAIESAVTRGMSRCDKYNDPPLTEAQRATLAREVEASFWLALSDAGVEIK
jgi:hypothetical protein